MKKHALDDEYKKNISTCFQCFRTVEAKAVATESKNEELEDKLRLTESRCRVLEKKLMPQTGGFKCNF